MREAKELDNTTMHHHLKRVHLSDQSSKYIPEIILGQLISISGGLIAGLLLSLFRHSFEPVVGFLILLPGVIDGVGNIQGSLSARLNHTVLRWPSLHDSRQAWWNNYTASIALGGFLGLALGIMAILMTFFIYGQLNINLLMISLVSCLIVNTLLTYFIGWLTDYLRDRGHNPDNVMGPILTSLADVVGIVILGLTVYWIG